MMLSRSNTGPSKIHGVGLFASEDIAAGTKVWEFTPGFDLVMSMGDIDRLAPAAKEQVLNYAYKSKESGQYILCSDDARFFNHAVPPNVTCRIPEGAHEDNTLECFALQDIGTGEEMTCDYGEWDADSTDAI